MPRLLRPFLAPLFGVCLLASACNLNEPATIAEQDATLSNAEALIAPWISDEAPGLAIAIHKDGETVLARGAGLANLEHGISITPDTVFHVASVSKQVTAFAIMMLVDEGKLALEDDIRTHLPELKSLGDPITVKHLLTHMSGYREIGTLSAMAGWFEDDVAEEAQIYNLIAAQTGRNFAPDARVEYSNTGYFLLARLVERISGEEFEDFTRTRLFEPLGMSRSRFHTDRGAVVRDFADSYFFTGEDYRKYTYHAETTGASGLLTTAHDLLKWANNFREQTVGSPRVFDLMAERSFAANGEASTFANGQELRPYNGLETWSHGGTIAGYKSFLMRVPSEDFAISILSNREDFDTAKLAFALVDVFLKDAPGYAVDAQPDWQPATEEDLEAFAGIYEFFPAVNFNIENTKDGLSFGIYGSGPGNLIPQIGQRTFELNKERGLSVTFNQDDDGKPTRLSYQIGLHGAIPAKRIELAPFDASNVSLVDYTGRFYSEELSTQFVFALKDGALTGHHPRLAAFNLSPYQPDTFATGAAIQKVQFLRDDRGAITGFLGSGPLALDVVFEKVG